MSINITKQHARRIALYSQLLVEPPRITGKKVVLDLIEHLGYIQIDTLSVVQRAHHHTLWNRYPDYKKEYLLDLQSKDRKVFEYWGHAASYLPMKDYRFYQHRMNAADDPNSKWEKDRLEKYGYLLEPVMSEIHEKGPCQAKDLELPGISFKREKSLPWDSTQLRFALNMLVFMGQLMITERKNFQKYYDLTERVLPSNVDTTLPTREELGRFLAQKALQSYGIATENEIRNHIFLGSKELIAETIKAMMHAREIEEIMLEGIDQNYYAKTDFLSKHDIPNVSNRVVLLSPFDNLIIQRDRIQKLFDFNYALECYVTPKKRVHGYFVCPILWKNRLVGRLDPKADRKNKTLILKNIFFEDWFDDFDEFIPHFLDALKNFRNFNECEEIIIESIRPKKLLKQLKL